MTEIGLTKSERRYYEIGYDAGFKQSRIETIRELEGKIERLFELDGSQGILIRKEEVKQILNSMKE